MRVACIWFNEPTALHKLAENCLRFGPQICLRTDEAIFIEIGKCRKLYSQDSFQARVQVLMRRLKLSGVVSFGEDITDSLLRAKFKVQDLDKLPLEALLDFCDPFNQDQVLRKYINKMIASFRDLGIESIGKFKLIPTSELVSRFGPTAILAKQRVNFETATSWRYWRPAEVISEKTDFPYFEFYGELEPLLFELKKQLDSIFQRLWSRGLKAQNINLKIYFDTNSLNMTKVRNFDFDFLFAQSETKGTLRIIQERLSRDFQKNPIRTTVEGIETTITATVPGAAGQRNLLHRHEEIAEQQQALLGQLTEIHGKENIFHAKLVEDRRPERSWRRAEVAGEEKLEITERIPLRPTHLLRPERIEVTAGFVHLRKRSIKILKWSQNVERITGGWQEKIGDLNNQFERNYYIIELEGGSTISVFQNPDQKYYLHGFFG